MLAELVAKGELPPVEERLPENPCVCPVTEGIGNYGGTMRRAFKGVSDRNGPTKVTSECPTWYNEDLTIRPNLIESWDVSEDAGTWTFNLRRGLKWSDGHPYTSADFQWYWDHELLNRDVMPSPERYFTSGSPSVIAEVETPDDLVVVITYAHPQPLFPHYSARRNPSSPGHYLEQFHADFVDEEELVRKAKDEGFGTWMDLFNHKKQWYNNPELPTLYVWRAANELSSELFIMERNPYFFQVDSAGNQLPYIDTLHHRLYETPDVFNMWIMNGEIDFQGRHVSIANYTLFKESEASGDFQVYLGVTANHQCLQANQTTKEPRLREFFQNRLVRLAMSYAVNREDMNELVYDGLAKPRQYSPLEQSPQYYPARPVMPSATLRASACSRMEAAILSRLRSRARLQAETPTRTPFRWSSTTLRM